MLPIGIGDDNTNKTEIILYDSNWPGVERKLVLYKNSQTYTSWEFDFGNKIVCKGKNGDKDDNHSAVVYDTDAVSRFVEEYKHPSIERNEGVYLSIRQIMGYNTSPPFFVIGDIYVGLDKKLRDYNIYRLFESNDSYDSVSNVNKELSFYYDTDKAIEMYAGDEAADYEFVSDYHYIMLSVPGEALSTVSVSDKESALAEIKMEKQEGPYNITYIDVDEDYKIIETSISGKGIQQISTSKNDSGIDVKADTLKDVKIETISSDIDGNNKIQISEMSLADEESDVSIKIDENGRIIEKKVNQTNSEAISNDGNVKKISLSGISHNIAAGKRIQLTAAVSPNNANNKKLKWTSTNPKVATVNQNGLVVVKRKTGGKTVVITAKATDGSGKKASWKIKSMKGVVKKIKLSGKKKVKAGKALKLKAKIKATKGANKKLKWTSSNTKYAIVNGSGKVKTLKAGKGKKVKITAQATDGSGKKKSITIKITK